MPNIYINEHCFDDSIMESKTTFLEATLEVTGLRTEELESIFNQNQSFNERLTELETRRIKNEE